jgi:hypothetical protein
MLEHVNESGERRLIFWLFPPVTVFSFALLVFSTRRSDPGREMKRMSRCDP